MTLPIFRNSLLWALAFSTLACSSGTSSSPSPTLATQRQALLSNPFEIAAPLSGPLFVAQDWVDVAHGAGTTLVAWTDTRGLSVAPLTADGASASALPLADTMLPFSYEQPDLAFDGYDFVLLHGLAERHFVLQRLSPQGAPVGEPVPLGSAVAAPFAPRLACNQHGGCAAHWRDDCWSHAEDGMCVGATFVQRLDRARGLLDAEPIFFDESEAHELESDVMPMGSSFFVVHSRYFPQESAPFTVYETWLQRVPEGGEAPEAPFKLMAGHYGGSAPQADGTLLRVFDDSTYTCKHMLLDGKLNVTASVETTDDGTSLLAVSDGYVFFSRGEHWMVQHFNAELVPDAGGPRDSGLLFSLSSRPLVAPAPEGGTLLVHKQNSYHVGKLDLGLDTLFAAPLDGHYVIAGEQQPIARATNYQRGPTASWNGSDFVVSWLDSAGSLPDQSLFRRHVTTAGTPEGPAERFASGQRVRRTSSGAHAQRSLFAWDELEDLPGTLSDTLSAHLVATDSTGVARPAAQISPDADKVAQPGAACGDHGCMAAWGEARGDEHQLSAAFFDESGAMMGSARRLAATYIGVDDMNLLRASWTGSAYVVTWPGHLEGETFGTLNALWLDQAGQVLSGPTKVLEDISLMYNFDVACAPQGCLFVADDLTSLVRAAFCARGESAIPVALPHVEAKPTSLSVTWNGKTFVVVATRLVGENHEPTTLRVSKSGRLLDDAFSPLGLLAFEGGRYPVRDVVALASDASGHTLLAYVQPENERLMGVMLTHEGPTEPGGNEEVDAGVDGGAAEADAGPVVNTDASVEMHADAGMVGASDAGPSVDEPDAAKRDAGSADSDDAGGDEGEVPDGQGPRSDGCSAAGGGGDVNLGASLFVLLAGGLSLRRRRARLVRE
jgi:hypothetical protein